MSAVSCASPSTYCIGIAVGRRASWVLALCAALVLPFGLVIDEAGAAPVSAQTSATGQERPAVMGAVSADSNLSVSINALTPRIMTSESELVISGTIRNDSPTTLASVSL